MSNSFINEIETEVILPRTSIAKNPTQAASPVVEQASKVKDILFAQDNVSTIRQSSNLIATAFKEIATLGWLVICWGIVAIAWFAETAIQSGRSFKQFLQRLQDLQQDQTPSDLAAEASKTVIDGSKNAFSQLLVTAKKQVGLLED